MVRWSQENIHKHMQVSSSDSQSLGKIAEVYEDSFLVHEGTLLKKSGISLIAPSRMSMEIRCSCQ
jgi:hypothetical protein